jgi:K+-sensing histidine kinase KdpD
MRKPDDRMFYLSAGSIIAMSLGAALVPLRTVATASNLALIFVALTIVIAELGGGWAALCTAACSALSLNFFLTRPYMRLTIHDRQDVIAFLGLASVGFIAAAFGSRREGADAALAEARRHFDALSAAARRLNEPASVEDQLQGVVEACRSALPVSALVVRDQRGYVAAASAGAHGSDAPARQFEVDALAGFPPTDGGRIRLVSQEREVGCLDVWGDGSPWTVSARHTLATFARLVAVRLATAMGS